MNTPMITKPTTTPTIAEMTVDIPASSSGGFLDIPKSSSGGFLPKNCYFKIFFVVLTILNINHTNNFQIRELSQ